MNPLVGVEPASEYGSPCPPLSTQFLPDSSSPAAGLTRTIESSSRQRLPCFNEEPKSNVEKPTNEMRSVPFKDERTSSDENVYEGVNGLTMSDHTLAPDPHLMDLRSVAMATFETSAFPPNKIGSSLSSEKGMNPILFFPATKKGDDSSFMHHSLHIDEIGDNHIQPLKDEKLISYSGEPTMKQGTASFFSAVVNCISLLLGLGILSAPYAVARAGWMGVIISTVLALSYWYTASLMMRCVMLYPELTNYQDLVRKTFGRRTQVLVTSFFYIEIIGTLIGYCVSLGDNLSYIFPSSTLTLPGLSGRNLMIFLASLCILPTIWLRDLGSISLTAFWCIASTVVLVIAVFLAATVNHIGFSYPVELVNIHGVPVAAGLFAFSFGGTSVFPSVYRSMKDPTKFPQAMAIGFIVATVGCAGLGLAGAKMFGANTGTQITLSMPTRLVATKIVLWMTVLTPMTKFALLLSPVTNEVETRLPWCKRSHPSVRFALGTLVRSMIFAAITVVAMVLPYFDYIVALIGSSMTISICIVLPSLFYIKAFYGNLKLRTLVAIFFLILLAVLVAIAGTITSFKGLINSKQSKKA